MSASFEQQREMIATFRSVVHSLFTVPEPLLMKDLDGSLIRHRVTTILNKLVDVSILTGASELVKEGRPNQLAWRFVDETAKEFLAKMVRDDAQISRLLWPDEEPDLGLPTLEKALDSALAAPPVEEASAAPQDPVSLVAAVLEGFNDRIAAMEKRTEEVDAKLDLVVGGLAELIAVVSKVAAREQVKPYDDTELQLGVVEQNELLKVLMKQLESNTNAANIFIKMSSGVNEGVESVRQLLGQVSKDGVQMKSEVLTKEFEAMAKVFTMMVKRFSGWAPAMQECIDGLKVVNKNQIDATEEMTGMQSAVIQALNSLAKGKGGILEMRDVPNPKPLPTERSVLRKHRGLPSLSQMLEKRDSEKQDKLPETIATMVADIKGDELQLSLRRQELAAQREEIEADIEDKTKEIDKLKAELTEEERALLDEKEAKMRAEAKKGG